MSIFLSYFYRKTSSYFVCMYIYVPTLHLHHINRNLLLSHAEDFKVGDHPLKKTENYI